VASAVEIEDVEVLAPGGAAIVRNVSLRIAAGESIALLGRSGAGKTTILRLLNGLTAPSRGAVRIDGVPLAGELSERRRRIGTILQAPALFPHRTVFETVATVPKLSGWGDSRVDETVRTMLIQVGLPPEVFASRFPRSLSGGEQQRVAIARALAATPALLLCDEPFSALDPIVRRELQDVFIDVCAKGGATVVFVTHDVAEALRVARRIALVEGGEVVVDAPREEFVRSANPLVRRFVESARLPEAS
jgi:osmoprotectant transport system ATP-binding protein